MVSNNSFLEFNYEILCIKAVKICTGLHCSGTVQLRNFPPAPISIYIFMLFGHTVVFAFVIKRLIGQKTTRSFTLRVDDSESLAPMGATGAATSPREALSHKASDDRQRPGRQLARPVLSPQKFTRGRFVRGGVGIRAGRIELPVQPRRRCPLKLNYPTCTHTAYRVVGITGRARHHRAKSSAPAHRTIYNA